jgi:hypothetical protein
MTDQYGGHAAALEIDGSGQMAAVYPDRREPLQLPAAARIEAGPRRRPDPFSLAGPVAAGLK